MSPKICKVPLSTARMANQAGMSVGRDSNGLWVVRVAKTRKIIRRVKSETEAKDFLRQVLNGNVPDLDGGISIPVRGEATIANPPRINETLGGSKLRDAIAILQLGPLARVTQIKTIASHIQKLKGYPILDKVYETTQLALTRVNEEIATIKRAAIKVGGKEATFQDALHEFADKILKHEPEQRELITLYAEAFTKEELAKPGVMLRDGLNEETIRLANILNTEVDPDNLPFLLRTLAVMEDFLSNRDMVIKSIPRMRNEILQGRIPEHFRPIIDGLEQSIGDEKDFRDVLKTMQLGINEQQAVILLRKALRDGEVNIPAMIRYASAPKAKAGFKNGREQFAAEMGMSKEAVSLAEERLGILREAFRVEGSGFSADQVIGAQYPIMRHLIDAGFFPGKQTGAPQTIFRIIQDSLGEGSEILGRRVLSGHLNPYELNPAVTANRHVLNMMKRKHFDPVLPEAKKVIADFNAAEPSSRLPNFFSEYLDEIQGFPSESFEKLTNTFRTVAQMVGLRVDDRIAERFIATLIRLTSQATIPLRLGLVARNATQNPFFLMPIVGPKTWYRGVKAALGWVEGEGFSLQNQRDAIRRAIKAGAVDPNVLPIHASDEVMGIGGVGGTQFGGLLGKGIHMAENLFDFGFSLYRTPDDLGRVASFEAGRHRVLTAAKKWNMSRRDAAAMKQFREDAKVETFLEEVGDKFERMVLDDVDMEDIANYIGKELADKVHLLYAKGNHPPGWNTVHMRLLGQFGTFPIQYADYVIQGLTRGTLKDKLEFASIHSALNMGVVVAGSELLGADLQNWMTFGSLTYTGGPYAELGISLAQAWGGSDAEKALARRNLEMMLPGMHQSVFVPGSYFLHDIAEAVQGNGFGEAIGNALGIQFLEPGEKNWVERKWAWVNEITR